MSHKPSANRHKQYKHQGKDLEYLKDKQNREQVELRKNKRDEILSKRRNITDNTESLDDGESPQ